MGDGAWVFYVIGRGAGCLESGEGVEIGLDKQEFHYAILFLIFISLVDIYLLINWSVYQW
ncbi:MAG TPA: hypothetical protein DDX93_02085 [Smithella sp.]|nr:hypothetical protein [Smithella sp.]